jgi:hypothetical protein
VTEGEAQDPAVAALVGLARSLSGLDPLRDEPAVIFRPLAVGAGDEPAEPVDDE